MSIVYFKAIDADNRTSEIREGAVSVLSRLLHTEHLELDSCVPLKVHFGEKGNETFICPALALYPA